MPSIPWLCRIDLVGPAKSVVTQTDKVPFVFFRGTEAVADAYEIIRIANGLTQEEFENTPVCYSVANSNSPLQLDLLMYESQTLALNRILLMLHELNTLLQRSVTSLDNVSRYLTNFVTGRPSYNSVMT